jgi:hypothetical protein
MYTDGVVPLTVLHFYLQKAEVIPEWLDVDLFKSMLDDESEFKNNPDAIAKMKGYNTAKDRVDARLQRRTLRNDEKITSITGEQVQTQADLERERLVHEAEEAERQRLADAAEAEKDRKLEKEKADQAAKTAAAAAKAMASRPAPAPGQNPQNKPAAPAAPAAPRKPGGSGGR